MKLKLQPPSGTELAPFNPILPPASITQIMLLANPAKVDYIITLPAATIYKQYINYVDKSVGLRRFIFEFRCFKQFFFYKLVILNFSVVLWWVWALQQVSFCSSMTMPQCTKQSAYRICLVIGQRRILPPEHLWDEEQRLPDNIIVSHHRYSKILYKVFP